jgi:hypothetical protein
LDIALNRSRGKQRPIGPFDRNIDEGKRRNGLALAVLEHLKIVFRQGSDELPLLIGDERVHLDVLNLGLERRGGRRRWLL